MNDYLKTFSLGREIVSLRGYKFLNYCRNTFFCDKNEGMKVNSTINQFQIKINDVFKDLDNIPERIDSIFESYLGFIKKLMNEKNQDYVFGQIMIFVNYLYSKLYSRHLFNTLSKNDLDSFLKMSFGNKINSVVYRDGNGKGIYNSGCDCKHYALLFKDFFDKLEKIGLNISNYLFIERNDGFNHVGLVITYKGKNYLVDRRHMQPIDELEEPYLDRMKCLLDLYKVNIPDNASIIEEDYIKHNENYYKVTVKDKNQLLKILNRVPPDTGNILDVHNTLHLNNIYDIILGVNFIICNKGIVLFGKIFYHFEHFFTEEELNNISDEDLLLTLINNISYKTKSNDDEEIRVFNFERKYLISRLHYFKDKINYKKLRELLTKY